MIHSHASVWCADADLDGLKVLPSVTCDLANDDLSDQAAECFADCDRAQAAIRLAQSYEAAVTQYSSKLIALVGARGEALKEVG